MNDTPRNPDSGEREAAAPPSVPPGSYFIAIPQADLTHDEEAVSLWDIWSAMLRHKWLIVAMMLCSTGAATAYAFLATPIYRASVLLAPASAGEGQSALSGLKAQYGGLAALAGINLDSAGGGSEEVAVATLKSRAFAESFIKERDLLPVLFANKWDAKSGRWKVRDAQAIPTMGDAYKLFNERIRSVSQDATTGLVTLSIQWKDRKQAAAWANALVERVNERMRERAISEAQRSIRYLRQELTKTNTVELKQAIYQLEQSQLQNIMLARARKEYAFRVIDPATVPDADKFLKPKRVSLIAGGILFGLFVGIVIATTRALMQHRED